MTASAKSTANGMALAPGETKKAVDKYVQHVCRVALQMDRLYDWKTVTDAPIRKTLDAQEQHVIVEFEQRLSKVKAELMQQVRNTIRSLSVKIVQAASRETLQANLPVGSHVSDECCILLAGAQHGAVLEEPGCTHVCQHCAHFCHHWRRWVIRNKLAFARDAVPAFCSAEALCNCSVAAESASPLAKRAVLSTFPLPQAFRTCCRCWCS